jgi:hypothetical protein
VGLNHRLEREVRERVDGPHDRRHCREKEMDTGRQNMISVLARNIPTAHIKNSLCLPLIKSHYTIECFIISALLINSL